MKPFTSICLLLIAAVWSPLFATDANVVTVKSSSVANGVVLIQAQVSNGDTTLQCTLGSAFCSAAPVGEYAMVIANSSESIYNDCTNVVLYSGGSGAKEKVGVYCWLDDGDCYVANCSRVQVSTVPSHVGSPVQNATTEKAAIKVPDADVLVTLDKRVYAVGQPPEITALIKNTGKEPFYVARFIGFAYYGEGVFVLHVTDSGGNEILETYRVGGHDGVPQGTDCAHYIEEEWLYLAPGVFFGATHRFEGPRLKPGRYTVTVEYVNTLYPFVAAGQSPAEIEQCPKKLKYPALVGKFRSNSVAFSVTK